MGKFNIADDEVEELKEAAQDDVLANKSKPIKEELATDQIREEKSNETQEPESISLNINPVFAMEKKIVESYSNRSLYIPDSLFYEIKKLSKESGYSISEYVTELLKKSLGIK